MDPPTRTLEALPSELLLHICSLLSPIDLSRVHSTCKALNSVACDDTLWHRYIQDNLPTPLTRLPESCSTYRELYTSLYPVWFLARQRFWFSDVEHYGKLIVARYNSRLGRIEAYSVVAELQRRHTRIERMTWIDGTVVEHPPFHPHVKLDYNQPVLSIECGDVVASRAQSENPTEVAMKTQGMDGVKCSLVFSRALSKSDTGPKTAVWPPTTVPAQERTRNESTDRFRSKGHLPIVPSGICESAFRLRKLIMFKHRFTPLTPLNLFPSSRFGPETVKTWGTIQKEYYTPTKDKPWQGIWCGDYSTHGPEFLLVMQPDNPAPLPPKARRAVATWPQPTTNPFGNQMARDEDDDDDLEDLVAASDEVAPTSMHAVRRVLSRSVQGGAERREGGGGGEENIVNDAAPYRGRIEAVKLTGDPNVPRGEFTFIAADIGQRGVVGYTRDPNIIGTQPQDNDPDDNGNDEGDRGARIVKSIGHVALEDFTNDAYIPSQLVLISENRLAQYWHAFEHVSFYQRVDVDKLLRE